MQSVVLVVVAICGAFMTSLGSSTSGVAAGMHAARRMRVKPNPAFPLRHNALRSSPMRLTVTVNGSRVYDVPTVRDDQRSRVAAGAKRPGVGGKGAGLWPNYWRKKRREHVARQKD